MRRPTGRNPHHQHHKQERLSQGHGSAAQAMVPWLGQAEHCLPDKISIRRLPRSASTQYRLNAMNIASQFYHVGTDDGYWSKIEVSPFPRCAHIPENQDLIDADVPTFEMNSNFVDDMKNALTLDVPTFAPRS